MKLRYILILVCLGIVLNACSAQSQAHYGSDVVVDSLPSDICVVDGKPLVLGINIENDNDIALLYIDKKGNVVAQHYGQVLLEGTHKEGKLIFTGGVCPSQ